MLELFSTLLVTVVIFLGFAAVEYTRANSWVKQLEEIEKEIEGS